MPSKRADKRSGSSHLSSSTSGNGTVSHGGGTGLWGRLRWAQRGGGGTSGNVGHSLESDQQRKKSVSERIPTPYFNGGNGPKRSSLSSPKDLNGLNVEDLPKILVLEAHANSTSFSMVTPTSPGNIPKNGVDHKGCHADENGMARMIVTPMACVDDSSSPMSYAIMSAEDSEFDLSAPPASSQFVVCDESLLKGVDEIEESLDIHKYGHDDDGPNSRTPSPKRGASREIRQDYSLLPRPLRWMGKAECISLFNSAKGGKLTDLIKIYGQMGSGVSSMVVKATMKYHDSHKHKMCAVKRVCVEMNDDSSSSSSSSNPSRDVSSQMRNEWASYMFCNEMAILHRLKGHRGCIQLIHSFYDCNSFQPDFFICMELAKEDLFSRIKTKSVHPWGLAEFECAMIMKNLLETVAFLHSDEVGVIHRDIKPENIVFRSSKDSIPVLIDFGDAHRVQSQSDPISTDMVMMDSETSFVGTPCSLAA